MPKLTVLIPCKNELENIAACVDSVRSLADEIIVADSGSTDGTREWAADDPGCRLIEREFINSGDFKNWAIPQATHSWVFILDADERVTPVLAASIRAQMEGGGSQLGYWVYRQNHFMGHRLKHTSWGRDRVVRLIQRDHARYRLHTDHAEIDLPSSQTGVLDGKLIHFTCWNYDNYIAKMLRYTEQQAELWYQQGRRPSILKLIFTGPFRFLRCYIIQLGCLDGRAGFQVATLTGFYSFLKQARLWRKVHGRKLNDIEQRVEPKSRVKATPVVSR